MTVFHGSYVQVTQPDVKRGRTRVDFGQGFYLTRLCEQATSWAQSVARRHRNGVPVLNVFDTVELYENGDITAEQALGQLAYKKVNHQVAILNQRVIDKCLRYVSSEEIDDAK